MGFCNRPSGHFSSYFPASGGVHQLIQTPARPHDGELLPLARARRVYVYEVALREQAPFGLLVAAYDLARRGLRRLFYEASATHLRLVRGGRARARGRLSTCRGRREGAK